MTMNVTFVYEHTIRNGPNQMYYNNSSNLI